MADRQSWLAVIQRGEEPADTDTEVVTLDGMSAEAGATIELTSGERITLVEAAGTAAGGKAAA